MFRIRFKDSNKIKQTGLREIQGRGEIIAWAGVIEGLVNVKMRRKSKEKE